MGTPTSKDTDDCFIQGLGVQFDIRYKSQKNKCTSSVWDVEEEEKHSLIAHIGHDCHDRQWCSFFKPVLFVTMRTRNFGLFWPLSWSFHNFWMYFLQAYIVWWRTKIDIWAMVSDCTADCQKHVSSLWEALLLSRLKSEANLGEIKTLTESTFPWYWNTTKIKRKYHII